MENKYTLEYIKEKGLILFESISGSVAYGTNTPTSDIDIRGVYIAELDDILNSRYPEQISDKTNDTTYYELGRFLTLVGSNNPNILELLNTPEDCIKYKNPLFDILIENRADLISKSAKNSFSGYALQQIQKAKGLNKKQNWEKNKMTRKDVLDFVYVIEGDKSILWKVWNKPMGYDEKFCGVASIPNARDLYAVYFDKIANSCFSDSIREDFREYTKYLRCESNLHLGFGYKGLVKKDEGENVAESNQLRLSSIPKGETPIAIISYNKDGYSTHCKDYKEYKEWLTNRNEDRYVQTTKEGQTVDSKNMMHCMRLIRMSKEIGRGEGIQVRRKDANELLAIRRGEVDLETLIETAEAEIKEMDKIFEESDLPKNIDPEFVNDLLVKIRREFYNL